MKASSVYSLSTPARWPQSSWSPSAWWSLKTASWIKLRELTQRENALLIFDEVITGFRLALGGAQEYFGVTPDLACFGKAMANGYPIAAVVGKREVMELFDEVFFSFTFGGEALSLAATAAHHQRDAREKASSAICGNRAGD